ncbi:MAG: Flp family type IVb pilin [Novosphingobium sp.]|nr:Flp family type IVb pilin [Novosphingobium sp.]
MSISNQLKKLISCERGATAIEYGLILCLIVIAIMASLQTLASEVITTWSTVSEKGVDAMNGP